MFKRRAYGVLIERLQEIPARIQVIAGPRQVGKTTVVRQVMKTLEDQDFNCFYFSADLPAPGDSTWIRGCWNTARTAGEDKKRILFLDEVQKIPGWSETVKHLWDTERNHSTNMAVVILGSSPLLVQSGLTESLAGRFEVIRMGHWDYSEMKEAFGYSLNEYLVYGGYPGAADLAGDFDRFRSYILDSLIETSISRDILMMNRIEKPVLLRNLFMLACLNPCRTVSYTKMLGQLQDAGNTTTLAYYLKLLEDAGLVAGLPKYSGSFVRRRASSPKLLPLNTALVSSLTGADESALNDDPGIRGKLTETCLGCFLYRFAMEEPRWSLSYWKKGDTELDFVLSRREEAVAIECYSGQREHSRKGLQAFSRKYPSAEPVLIGKGGLGVEEILSMSTNDLNGVLEALF